MLKKVKLTISRTKGLKSSVEKIVSMECEGSDHKTRKLAELNYCNEYAKRANRGPYQYLSDAKAATGLKITSKTIN